MGLRVVHWLLGRKAPGRGEGFSAAGRTLEPSPGGAGRGGWKQGGGRWCCRPGAEGGWAPPWGAGGGGVREPRGGSTPGGRRRRGARGPPSEAPATACVARPSAREPLHQTPRVRALPGGEAGCAFWAFLRPQQDDRWHRREAPDSGRKSWGAVGEGEEAGTERAWGAAGSLTAEQSHSWSLF